MNVLIVHAHPELKSFTTAMKNVAVQELAQRRAYLRDYREYLAKIESTEPLKFPTLDQYGERFRQRADTRWSPSS
jgi:hypothetical protein